MAEKKARIKILKNGPYVVKGNIPLKEGIITPKGKSYVWEEGRPLPQAEQYLLCRCGATKTPPFCDGIHAKLGFQCTDRALKDAYERRAKVIEGPEIDLLDDGRCSVARFCHRRQGDVWDLTETSHLPGHREEAIQGAYECPSGRLTARTKDGELFDPPHDPEIVIVQDPQKEVSGGIYVKGRVELEGSDGEIYGQQNRVTLCRCGQSRNMPFCDARHISAKFRDEE